MVNAYIKKQQQLQLHLHLIWNLKSRTRLQFGELYSAVAVQSYLIIDI